MKKITLALLLFCILPLGSMAQGIVFETGTLSEALEKAGKENKLVFVDFYTDWCGPCKKMSSSVFTDGEVGAYFNEKFVNCKIDAEKGEGPELAKKYKIKGYPSMFFLNPDGSAVHMILGAKDKDAFLEEARGLGKASKYGGMMKMKEEFEEGRSDEQFLKDLYKFLPEKDELRGAVPERYLLETPIERLASEADDDIVFVGDMLDGVTGWNEKLMYRMLDLLETKMNEVTEGENRGRFSANYNLGVVFSVELLGGRLINMAIEKGDGELLEKTIKFQQDYRRRIDRGVDGDTNIYSGRGIFFASPEFIRLQFMAANKTEPERFLAELPAYMEQLMAETPVDSLRAETMPKGFIGEMLKERSPEVAGFIGMTIYSRMRESDIAMDNFTGWINYYWRLMPNDRKTKQTVGRWLAYTATINPFYTKGVMATVPLLVKVGHKKDALAVLQYVLDTFDLYMIDKPEYTGPIKDTMRDIENDKI